MNGISLLCAAQVVSSLVNEGGAALKLVLLFVGGLPETIKEIKFLYKNEDWDELSLRVHGLKGTAGNFGFLEVSEVTEMIEEMILNNRFDEIEIALYKLDRWEERISAGKENYVT